MLEFKKAFLGECPDLSGFEAHDVVRRFGVVILDAIACK
jgi:hypothetical protein